jgi:A/G-specific adenine glycosylase
MDNFADRLIFWYGIHKRDLPWRHTTDPYKIWLSEVILHQTRVVQGMPYYERYVCQYPTIQALASASEDEVLRLWQGLGYYSRARNMHKTAKQIVEMFGGKFPDTAEGLSKLKGVGSYTTAAIGSFAFNLPLAVIDGNVKRVLARYMGMQLPIDSREGNKQLTEIAQQMLPKDRPAIYNQAIMEFGALQCVPRNPNCMVCLFETQCQARKLNMVQLLPLKTKQIVKRNRFFNYLIVEQGDRLWMQKRNAGDVWEGLYEFFLVEGDKLLDLNEIAELLIDSEKKINSNWAILNSFNSSNQWEIIGDFKHVLTHLVIWARFIKVMINADYHLDIANMFDKDAVEKLPKPILIERIFKKYI